LAGACARLFAGASREGGETKQSWNLAAGADLAPGRTVVEPLGGGRRYEVFLVRDAELGIEAVAKVLRPDRIEDELAVNAMRREAALLERLEHPVVVRGLGAVLDPPLPHLLLAYVEGANLRQVLSDYATLPVGEALDLAIDLLDAADYLAEREVVHLDIKPSNVVLADPACLIDLGAARTLEELAVREAPIGTAWYMAPEQCDPGSTLGPIGPPADVWGVGATLYHALTGNRPFSRPGPRGADPFDRYPQLREDVLPIPDYVPEPVAGTVLGMLARSAEDRPTAAEAADALESLADTYGEG
jgi:serine/threonine protein kinase